MTYCLIDHALLLEKLKYSFKEDSLSAYYIPNYREYNNIKQNSLCPFGAYLLVGKTQYTDTQKGNIISGSNECYAEN